jgi:RHS repeat-associated protein
MVAVSGCKPDFDVVERVPIVETSPATLSNAEAWALFDRSMAVGYIPTADAIRAALDRPEEIAAIKVFGSAPYRLQVTGSDAAAIGFDEIDLMNVGPGWHTFPSNALATTNAVELRFTSVGVPTKIPELEIWTSTDSTSFVAGADPSAPQLPAGYMKIDAEIASATLAESQCANFAFEIARSPGALRRAYLVYDAIGAVRPFELQRSINGLGQQGGVWMQAATSSQTLVDRFDPALLQLGTNAVRLCSPSDATNDVALSNLRLVGELDRGTSETSTIAIGDAARDGSALLDGNPSTTANIGSDERVAIAFDHLISPDTVLLASDVAPDLAAAECVDLAGETTDLATHLQAITNGLEIDFEGGTRACAGLSLRFSSAVTLGELNVIGSPAGEPVDWAHIMLTSPTEHFGDRAWVGGYIARPTHMPGAIRVSLSGHQLAAMTGDIGAMLTRATDLGAPWPVQVGARLPNGITQTVPITLDRDARSLLSSKAVGATVATGKVTAAIATTDMHFGRVGDVVAGRATTASAITIQLGNQIRARLPAGAVAAPTNVTIQHLDGSALPPLDPGMVNVTAPEGHGYEFLPHGQHFAKSIEVVLPYDPHRIPSEMSDEDVRTFYYDTAALRWKPLERTGIDLAEHGVHSATDHFTIMIDAVLAVPKDPSPLSFDPTAMSSIGAASPAANIDLVEPPQANSTGDARTSLPIRLPKGRGAYSPSLAIAYSSSGGNGWLGVGWDLAISGIEIDTRWGVPTYGAAEEPRYLLDGAELVPTVETEGPTCQSGTLSKRYHTRIEGSFAHIIRCDRGGRRFHFEVHDRDGTLYVYGPDADGNPGNSALADPGGPLDNPQRIFRWDLLRVVDVHGNTTMFSNTLDLDLSGQPAIDLYPATISYTEHPDSPQYAVDFILDDGSRPDHITSGRQGFKTATTKLLRAVRVRFQSQVIREYVLTYNHGEFQKSLLASIAVYGGGGCGPSLNAFSAPTCSSGGQLFHTHTFDYFTEDMALDDPLAWNVSDDPSPDNATLGKGTSQDSSGSFSLGGVVGGANLGAAVSGATGSRSENLGVYDVNGDGLPDQIYATLDGFPPTPTIHVLYNQSQPGMTPASGPLLSANGPDIDGLIALGFENTGKWGVSATASAETNGVGGSISAGFSNSTTRAMQFVTDVNGDGFMDLIHADPHSSPFAISTAASFGQPCSGGAAMCFADGPYSIGTTLDPHDDNLLANFFGAIQSRLFVGDPVVQWVAPFDGTITITGTVAKPNTGGTDGVIVDLYHQDSSIASITIAATDTDVTAFPTAPLSLAVNAGEAIYLRTRIGVDDGSLNNLVNAQLGIAYSHACTAELGCIDVSDPTAYKDPTGAPVFSFTSSSDFRLAGTPNPFTAFAQGTINVQGIVAKQATVADVRVCIQRISPSNTRMQLDVPCSTNSASTVYTLPAASTDPLPLSVPVDVSAGDQIIVRAESDLSFDPSGVSLQPAAPGQPTVVYTQACLPTIDGTSISCVSDPSTLGSVPSSTVNFGLFVSLGDPTPHGPFLAPFAGQVEVMSPAPPSEPFVYAIRSDVQGIISVFDCRSTSCSLPAQDFAISAGESLTIELVTQSGTGPSTVQLTYTGEAETIFTVPLIVRALDPTPPISPLFVGGYRGWHAGIWNENESFQPVEAVDAFNELETLAPDLAQQLFRRFVRPLPAFAGSDATGTNPVWVAPSSLAFISAASINAASVGSNSGSVFGGGYLRLSGTQSTFLSASVHFAGGIFGGGFDLNATSSTTDTTQDAVDMNGDGILDIVQGHSVLRGLLTASATPTVQSFDAQGSLRERAGHEYAVGFSGDGSCTPTITSSGRELACDNPDGADTGLGGISGGTGYGIGRNESKKDLVDVNGDGLPDLVTKSGANISVQLNLGDHFGQVEPFGQFQIATPIDSFETDYEQAAVPGFSDSTSDAIQHDTTLTRHDSGGFSLNFVVAKIGVSASSIQSASRTARQLVDINGDGLPDLVQKKSGQNYFNVQLNLGDHFSAPFQWSTGACWCGSGGVFDSGSCPLSNAFIPAILGGEVTDGDVVAATGTQGGSSVSGSVSVLGAGVSGSSSNGTDTYELALIDIDGDGVADHVLRHGVPGDGGKIYVRHNRITGKANLLQTVHRPLGGTVSLDYTRTANSVALPHSRYTLAKVAVDDGANLPAPFESPAITTTVSYGNGFFDRNEKEFFGFDAVTTTRPDGVSVEDDYNNRTYQLHGRLQQETRRDSSSRVFRQHTISYSLLDVDDASGNPVQPDPSCLEQRHPLLDTDACVPHFPTVVEDDDTRSEGGSAVKTRRIRDQSHDRFGAVLESQDLGDDAIGTDDLDEVVAYENDTTNWILGRATSLHVYSGTSSGPLLRSRTGEYDALGELTAVHVNTGSAIATTTMSYDDFGNLAHLQTPPNELGQSQTYDVSYDAQVSTYPATMTDAFGYTSSAQYDVRFGVATLETDVNQAQMSRTVDDFGRIVSISGPYDTHGPGLSMQYFPAEAHPRAVTVMQPSVPADYAGPVPAATTTVTFSDGFGRTIEQNKTAVVNAVLGMSTTGLVERDTVGRVIRTQNPLFSPGVTTSFVAPQSTLSTSVVYDALDRPVLTAYPDGATESMSFDVTTNPDGLLFFLSRSIDPNGHARESYADHLGRTRTFVEHPATTTSSITRYDYLGTGELSQITDAEGNLTTLGYDLRGLRTSLNNPDDGLIEDQYDLMGHRITLTEPNHRALGVHVHFIYDHDRLTTIDYPSKPDVTYTYGAPGAPKFGANRVTQVSDETGTQTHEYGALGEVRRTVRTFIDPAARHPSPVVFDLQLTTDSFGRQLQIGYPDGEMVTNSYDAAGLLSGITGAGNGWSRTYVSDLRYDEFGNRTRAAFGNGDVSVWTFDPKRIRLTSISTTTAAATPIQSLAYTYDPASNPLSINNNLPPTPTDNSLPGTSAQTFTYDGVDRLVSATGSGTLNANKNTNYTETFSYTASHNILHKTLVHQVVDNGGHITLPSDSNYDSAYAYGATRPHLPTTIGDLAVAYDPSGNPVTRTQGRSVQTLTWDDDNRMVQVQGFGANQRNLFDASGQRVLRDGQGTTIFANQFFEYDSKKTGTKHVFAGAMRVASVQGGFSSGESPAPPRTDGTAYFFHENFLGSSGVITTESGDVNDAHEYFPDGGDWIDAGKGNSVDGFLFSGKEFDPDTGFYDFGQRFYDPRSSIWLGIDRSFVATPSVADRQPAELAPLAYSANRPLALTDPTGLQFQIVGCNPRFCKQQPNALLNTFTEIAGGVADFNLNQARSFVDQVVSGSQTGTSGSAGSQPQNTGGLGNQLTDAWDRGGALGVFGVTSGVDSVSASGHAFVDAVKHRELRAAITHGLELGQWGLGIVDAIGLGAPVEEFPGAPGRNAFSDVRAPGANAGIGPGAALRNGPDFESLLGRDRTGKIHGEIPSYVPSNWSTEELEQASDELRESIQRRKEEQLELGEDSAHRVRINDEERFLRQITKKYEDLIRDTQ